MLLLENRRSMRVTKAGDLDGTGMILCGIWRMRPEEKQVSAYHLSLTKQNLLFYVKICRYNCCQTRYRL